MLLLAPLDHQICCTGVVNSDLAPNQLHRLSQIAILLEYGTCATDYSACGAEYGASAAEYNASGAEYNACAAEYSACAAE